MENTGHFTAHNNSGLQIAVNSGPILLLGQPRGKNEALKGGKGPSSSGSSSLSKYQQLSDLDKLIENVSEYDFAKAQRRILQFRQAGTCRWLVELPIVKAWLEGSKDYHVWCHAKVGYGKTILASTLVEATRGRVSELGCFVGHYYIVPSAAFTPSAVDVIQGLIKQQLVYLNKVRKSLSLETHSRLAGLYGTKHNFADVQDVMEIFKTLSNMIGAQFYILDGVDLLDPQDAKDLFQVLRETISNAAGSRMFLFSRKYIDRNINVINLIPKVSALELLEEHNRDDIEMIIRNKLNLKTATSRQLSSSEELMEYVKRQLLLRAHGMILWVDLKIEELWEDCETDHEIRDCFHNLHEKLEDIYLRCLQRIQRRKREDLASCIFRWIACGSRLLHIDELQEAVAFSESDRRWSQDNFRSEKLLIDSCANLVVVSSEDRIVRFIHPSVQQYLQHKTHLSEFRVNIGQDRLKCGAASMNYLSFEDFASTVTAGPRKISTKVPVDLGSRIVRGINPQLSILPSPLTRLIGRSPQKLPAHMPVEFMKSMRQPEDATKFKFLSYARQFWVFDCQDMPRDSDLWERFHVIATTPNVTWNFHPWGSQANSYEEYQYKVFTWLVVHDHLPLLQLLQEELSSRKLKEFCLKEFPQALIPHALAITKMSAPFAAAALGHEKILKELLKHTSVKIDAQGRRLIDYAVMKGSVACTKLLLGNNPSEHDLSRLIRLAASQGQTESVQFFFAAYSHLFAESDFSMIAFEALEPAIIAGYDDTAELLVKISEHTGRRLFSQRFDHKGFQYWIAMHRMILTLRQTMRSFYDEQLGEDLLDRANTVYGHTWNFLGTSTYNRHIVEFVRAYMEMPTVNWESSSPMTAHSYVQRILIDTLCLAIYFYEISDFIQPLVELLKDYRMPRILWIGFTLSAFEGQTDVLDLMLSLGVSAQAILYIDGRPHTSLSFAVMKDKPVAVSMLSRCGVDLDHRLPTGNWHGGSTALHIAVLENSIEALSALLECGARVDVKDEAGFTPIQRAAYYKRPQAALLLLNHGASVNLKDSRGRTLFHLIAMDPVGNTTETEEDITRETIQLILKDPACTKGEALTCSLLNSKDEAGFTPIHTSLIHRQRGIVEELTLAGADINATGPTGQTALHFAISYEEPTFIALLLTKDASVLSLNSVGQPPHFYLVDRLELDFRIIWSCGESLIILKMLQQHGAEINAQDIYGNTLFYMMLRKISTFLQDHQRYSRPDVLEELLRLLAAMVESGADTSLRPPDSPPSSALVRDWPRKMQKRVHETIQKGLRPSSDDNGLGSSSTTV